MLTRIVTFFLFLIASCTACSSLSSEPTPTPTPDATVTPAPPPAATNTPQPSFTPTRRPSRTPTIDPFVILEMEGEPLAEWKGIPIMPDAVAGEEIDKSYYFSIKASNKTIEEFYMREMDNLGWEYAASATNAQGETVIMMFRKGDTIYSFVISSGLEGLTIVMITEP